MTVNTTTSRADYTGNGVTTAFTVPFYFLDNTHIQVLRTDTSTGVITTLTLATDYTVSGAGVSGGGTVTCTVAPTNLQKISILRNVPLTQLAHYVPNDPFPAATHEQALDQLTMEVQQVNEIAGRALTLPANTPAGSVSSALPTPQANKLIGWNSSASQLQNVDAVTLSTLVAYGTANADKFSGNGSTTVFALSANPGALNNLDVSISGVTQRPGIDYTWTSGTTLTFTSAPPSGTNNILVRYMQGLPQGTSDSASALFVQSGTGSVTRVAQDKLREIVSVKDYGAKGDGLTDDTASIQAALNYIVTNGGGTLFLPPGTYNVTSLSLNNNGSQAPIYIRGCGPRSTVIKKTGTSLAALLTLQTTLNVLETYHEISDLTLWGNNGASNHNGLSLTNYALFVFRRVQIRECYACFYGAGSLVGSIYDCTFKDSQFGVILRKSSDNVYSNDLNFHGCIFAGASQWAADISQGSGIRFTGCDFESNGQTGVSNTGALMMRGGLSDEFGWSQVSVLGCWFESNKGTTISSEASAVNVRMSFRDSFVASSDSLSAINLQGAHTVEIDGLLATSPSTTVTLAAAISAVTLRNSTITTLVNNCVNTTQINVTTYGGLTRFKTESSAGSYIIDTVGHKFTGPVLVNNAPNLANHTIAANGATENALVCLNTDTGASSQSFVVWRRGSGNGVVTGSISNTSTTTAYNTLSDYRLKDDPRPLTGSGEFIDALQPKVWKWKVDGSRGVGFIAHEVQAVSPVAVTGAKDAIDEHGNPEYQTMEYGSAEFVANIVAELQALRKRVSDLEERQG